MKRREAVYLIGMVITVLFAAFALGLDETSITLAQSPQPTPTRTPTSIPPTSTNTPVPPTPTDTPVPPTPTDTKPPVSWVRHLRRVHFTRSFRVRWTGYDPGGSGIKCYDVQYKDGAGSWQDWKTCTTATSAKFHGEWWHRYFFRVRAIDNAGNGETWPSRPDTWTRVWRRN